MNRSTTLLVIAAVTLFGAARMHPRADAAKNAVQTLQAIKDTNQKLIDAQTATLTKLDEVGKDADQLRAFAKRS
jgi:hypothetical protein